MVQHNRIRKVHSHYFHLEMYQKHYNTKAMMHKYYRENTYQF
jgi:hypothetical protein